MTLDKPSKPNIGENMQRHLQKHWCWPSCNQTNESITNWIHSFDSTRVPFQSFHANRLSKASHVWLLFIFQCTNACATYHSAWHKHQLKQTQMNLAEFMITHHFEITWFWDDSTMNPNDERFGCKSAWVPGLTWQVWLLLLDCPQGASLWGSMRVDFYMSQAQQQSKQVATQGQRVRL